MLCSCSAPTGWSQHARTVDEQIIPHTPLTVTAQQRYGMFGRCVAARVPSACPLPA
jgi:hypothetical protein